MSFVNVLPQTVADAATSIGRIGASLEDAGATASPAIGGILPPGAEEVSEAITALFNEHAVTFQALLAQATSFQQQFVNTLAAGRAAYENTEFAALQTLWTESTVAEQPFIPVLDKVLGSIGFGSTQLPTPSLPNAPVGQTVALLVGGTGYPVLGGQFPGLINSIYFPGVPSSSVGSIFTPEQFWPLTPTLGGLTLGQSFAQGVPLLNAAINTEISTGHNVVVWTTSQSSTVATMEIRNLMAQGSPNVGKLSFVLTGDPNNPNGGFLERFVGAYVPGLDVLFNGATPPNSPYATQIWTNQYDGVSNFPRYPLNIVSDTNALFGFAFGAHDYVMSPWEQQNAVLLQTSPGYTGNTQYYFDVGQNLPLVQPFRIAGLDLAPYTNGYSFQVGNAVADLFQPDLRVISDLGYDNYGPTGDYPNIPTPGSLLEFPNWGNVGRDLVAGTIQGPTAFAVDLGLLPQSDFPTTYPYAPSLTPNLNYPLPQTSVTGLSQLTSGEGWLANQLGLIPPWDDYANFGGGF